MENHYGHSSRHDQGTYDNHARQRPLTSHRDSYDRSSTQDVRFGKEVDRNHDKSRSSDHADYRPRSDYGRREYARPRRSRSPRSLEDEGALRSHVSTQDRLGRELPGNSRSPYDSRQEGTRVASSTPGCRIFVINISSDAKWYDLRDLMQQAGEVEYTSVKPGPDGRASGTGIVQFRTPEMAMKAIRDFNQVPFMGRQIIVREDRMESLQSRQTPDQARGYSGFDRQPMESVDRLSDRNVRSSQAGNDAVVSIRAVSEKQDIGHRNVVAPVGSQGTPCSQIFVKNLPFETSIDDLRDLFSYSGTVLNAEILCDYDRRPRGFAIVEFDGIEGAESAIAKFHRYDYGGRSLTIEYNGRFHRFN